MIYMMMMMTKDSCTQYRIEDQRISMSHISERFTQASPVPYEHEPLHESPPKPPVPTPQEILIQALQEDIVGHKEKAIDLQKTLENLKNFVVQKENEISEAGKALILEKAHKERTEKDVEYYQGIVLKKDAEIEEVVTAKKKLDKNFKEEVDKIWIEAEEKIAKHEHKIKAEESRSRALESKCRAMFEEIDVLRNEISNLNSYYKLTFEKNKSLVSELEKSKSDQ